MKRRFSEHCEYLMHNANLPQRYNATNPPCNEAVSIGLAVAAIISSAVSGAMQYQQAEEQAKQSEYNADAENKALKIEADRQQAEFEANRRRTMLAQRRARATQLSQIADSGFMTGTGTTLEIEADTWNKQQLELADMGYYNSLGQRELAYKRQTVLEMGKQQAGQYRGQKAGIIVNTIGKVAGQASTLASAADKGNGQQGGGTGTAQTPSGGSAGWDGKL